MASAATLEQLAKQLPPLPRPLLLGLSGGADSVALLCLLQAAGIPCRAVHVNHGLRGPEADLDEAFVRELCEARQVPLTVCRLTPTAHPSEDWARSERYRCFQQAMQKSGCAALALAHHMDDQAETMLLHLMRGSGLSGLCGMRADDTVLGMRVVRPLLGFPHAALCSALTAAGQSWREDGSNAGDTYLRNRVRHQLLPLMEQLSPGAAGRMAKTAHLLARDDDALRTKAAELLAQHTGGHWFRLAPLRDMHAALQVRCLRLWWHRAIGSRLPERVLSAAQTDALLSLVRAPAGSRCNLPGGWHAQSGWRCLHLISPEKPAPAAPVAMTAAGAELNGIRLSVSAFTGAFGDGVRCQAVPLSALNGAVLRCREAGDYLVPFGGGGRQSLQDVLVNRKIDAPFRDSIPLLCRGKEILMICGVCAGNLPMLQRSSTHESTDVPVMLRWEGPMPWAE